MAAQAKFLIKNNKQKNPPNLLAKRVSIPKMEGKIIFLATLR